MKKLYYLPKYHQNSNHFQYKKKKRKEKLKMLLCTSGSMAKLFAIIKYLECQPLKLCFCFGYRRVSR